MVFIEKNLIEDYCMTENEFEKRPNGRVEKRWSW